MLSIAILTGDQPRHKFFADTVAQSFNVAGVVYEKKKDRTIQRNGLTPEDLRAVEWWEETREAADKNFFGAYFEKAPAQDHLLVDTNHINDQDVAEWVFGKKPDILCVFGTGIIKEIYMRAYPKKILNMHLGISPDYRGSSTTLWPLINRDFDNLGVSIIFLDAGVDTGDIISQGHPQIEEGDDPHAIGAKIAVIGTGLMKQALKDFENGIIKSSGGGGGGRQYMRKEWGIEQIKALYKMYAKQ